MTSIILETEGNMWEITAGALAFSAIIATIADRKLK